MKYFIKNITAFWIYSLVLGYCSFANAVDVQVKISKQNESVNLQFSGLENWNYSIDRKNKDAKTEVIDISIPKLEEQSVSLLEKFKSEYITKVSINRNGPDGKYIISFELADKEIEAFDYLTDQPSRLVVDLFREKTSVKTVEKIDKKDLPKVKPIAKEEVVSGASRVPASEVLTIANRDAKESAVGQKDEKLDSTIRTGIFDGGDPNFERFQVKDYEVDQKSIEASKRNIYMNFPMLTSQSPYLEIMKSQRPLYEVKPTETDENKQARLLLTLFEKQRYNVFLKTLDWFFEKYPTSQYDEMLRFMWADALYELYQKDKNLSDFDLAMLRYREALEKYPASALAERTSLFVAFSTLDRGDYLGTIRQFQNHLQRRPKTPNRDIAMLAIAEAYRLLNRPVEALAAYDQVIKDSSEERFKIEAMYLKGDVSYQKQDYQKAVEDYQKALSNYPQSKSSYPNALYNQASAYFGLKEYKKSLDVFNEFLRNFPSHQYASYAMTRVAELLETLGADAKKVNGALMETTFRYGDTEGSLAAKLKLLTARIPSMKPKELEKTLLDIEELVKKSNLPKIYEISRIKIADALAKRGEFDTSIDMLIKYYQANPTTADTQLVNTRIVRYINDQIKDTVGKGDFINALRVHNKYVGTWLKKSDRLDTKYMLGKAFEQSGVYSEADSYYKYVLNKMISMKGTPNERDRDVFEDLPPFDEVNLRLASVNMLMSRYNQAADYLKNIKNPENLTDIEQIERVQAAATIFRKKGEFEVAERYLVDLVKTWQGLPELVAEPYFELASIEQSLGKENDAIQSLEKIDQLMVDSGGKVNALTHSKALEQLVALYDKKKDAPKTVQYLSKLLDAYEKSRPLYSLRYRLGEIHFESGDLKKANEAWAPLRDNDRSSFWWRLSQEKLKSANWDSEYKKYVDRIPAMADTPSKQ